jgi:hypothetical protein
VIRLVRVVFCVVSAGVWEGGEGVGMRGVGRESVLVVKETEISVYMLDAGSDEGAQDEGEAVGNEVGKTKPGVVVGKLLGRIDQVV